MDLLLYAQHGCIIPHIQFIWYIYYAVDWESPYCILYSLLISSPVSNQLISIRIRTLASPLFLATLFSQKHWHIDLNKCPVVCDASSFSSFVLWSWNLWSFSWGVWCNLMSKSLKPQYSDPSWSDLTALTDFNTINSSYGSLRMMYSETTQCMSVNYCLDVWSEICSLDDWSHLHLICWLLSSPTGAEWPDSEIQSPVLEHQSVHVLD